MKTFRKMMAIALALKKSTKAVRKSNVSRNITAQVQVKTGKVKRKMPYLTEAMGEEEVVLLEELK